MQVTPAELSLIQFADALTGWLQPYHDFIRPPPAAVLAEAARITEQKTGGHQIKSLATPPNGTVANGHSKKDEEPPAVKEPPEVALKFFDGTKELLES